MYEDRRVKGFLSNGEGSCHLFGVGHRCERLLLKQRRRCVKRLICQRARVVCMGSTTILHSNIDLCRSPTAAAVANELE